MRTDVMHHESEISIPELIIYKNTLFFTQYFVIRPSGASLQRDKIFRFPPDSRVF